MYGTCNWLEVVAYVFVDCKHVFHRIDRQLQIYSIANWNDDQNEH